ncbi:hypothetical protein Mgra_00000331 [Meloidogyne graminicola]|uniref:Uncharacterized protein n=1 Tax=Meloidogyne graminicola TaxID=189291 RepID=A0A8T0A534_9BILA|nr:hypothetical protein Mgra_00000331 [Meloidogyne graminicola]
MNNIRLLLNLLVTAVILSLYTMNTAIWPYSKGIEIREQSNDEVPCQVHWEQHEFMGRTFRHELLEFFLFVNNTYLVNNTYMKKHKNIYKKIVKRLKEITNGFNNPKSSKFSKQPKSDKNILSRGRHVKKEYRCL